MKPRDKELHGSDDQRTETESETTEPKVSKTRQKEGLKKPAKQPEKQLLKCCHITFVKQSDGTIVALPGNGCSQEDLEEIAMAAVNFAAGEDEEDPEAFDDEDVEDDEE
jgi:hypothetical protein